MKISRGASLDRWYLFKFLGFGLMLHRIHHTDPERLFHNHPWSAFSLIFGSYGEEMLTNRYRFDRESLETDFKIRYFFNWLPAKRYHRVVILRPVWTLVFHLPKSNEWRIVDRKGHPLATAPWKGAEGYKDYESAVTSP